MSSTYGVHIRMLMMIPIIYKMSDITSNIILNVYVIVIFSLWQFYIKLCSVFLNYFKSK